MIRCTSKGIQQRLQELIDRDHGGELPVGMAVIVSTQHPDIPWCISAPTMRVPRDVAETVNAYLAFRAALRAVLAHNATGLPKISTVLCPGLGTAAAVFRDHDSSRFSTLRDASSRLAGRPATTKSPR